MSEPARVVCPLCGNTYKSAGIKNHLKACQTKTANRENDKEFFAKTTLQAAEEILKHQASKVASSSKQASPPAHDVPPSLPATSPSYLSPPFPILNDSQHVPAPDPSPGSPIDVIYGDHPPEIDDIKCEYHPSSERVTEIHHFDEYGQQPKALVDYLLDDEPWRPFRTRRDFEFASVAIKESLNQTAINSLLELTFGATGRDPSRGPLTLQSYEEMMNIWKLTANKMPGFTKHSVSATYKNETLSYDVWRRPVWDWITKLLQDPRLAPYFEWDAKKLSKFDGESWVRYYDEPVSGNMCWEIQTTLPDGGKPLILIIYADKTRLSTFGTAKGYPVIVRIGNLPAHIRNGSGPGGGVMIGWLPVIEELASETHKPKWTTLKATIYHRAMGIILEDITNHSHTGFSILCGDNIRRLIFPAIPIKSADFEEDCVMTLTRGTGSYCPCPVCLVPEDQLANHDAAFPLRTQGNMKKVYMEAMVMRTVEERNALLRQYSLRPVENAFWGIANSDPYHSVSFDCLHTFDGGLFDDHIFKQLLLHFEAIGRSALTKVDLQMDAFPRWRNLNHFKAITTLTFNDGSKSEDISKCLLFATHNILTRLDNPAGYTLLKCLRCYINLRMFAGLQVHTSKTITAGRLEVKRLSGLLKEYQTKATPEFQKKSWNFPKNHLYVHLFDDIEQKGVTLNYNTKPNEQAHGALKTSYRRQTNFKNVAPQILMIDHINQVREYIQAEIDDLDASRRPPDIKLLEENDDAISHPIATTKSYSLGSPTKSISLEQLESNHSNDPAFQRFRLRLADFLNKSLNIENQPGPRYLRAPGDQNTQITPSRLLITNYESMVDWRQSTDLLRCNPMFQGAPCYDHVIIKTNMPTTLGTDIIGQLLLIFTIRVNTKSYDLALVQPLDRPPGTIQQKDADLQLRRLRIQPRKSAEFFFLSSIIRGALVVPDFGSEGYFFLVDTVDGDMFLRYRFPSHNSN